MLAKEEESVFRSSSWCWHGREDLARCCGGIGTGRGEGKGVCTDLAIKGARICDVFLGLVRIHWVVSVGKLGCGDWNEYFRIARRSVLFCDGESDSWLYLVKEREVPLGSESTFSV